MVSFEEEFGMDVNVVPVYVDRPDAMERVKMSSRPSHTMLDLHFPRFDDHLSRASWQRHRRPSFEIRPQHLEVEAHLTDGECSHVR